jgi:Ala-tRNA(Pro) deacylase
MKRKKEFPMELLTGRPENCQGRLPKEIRVYDLLDSLQIEYQRIDHEPAMTMEACAAIDEALDAVICKNLLLCNRQQTEFYLLMIPGGKQFKTSVLSKQIGSSRLSFASAEHMERLLDITPGSVSVLGLMNDSEKQVQLRSYTRVVVSALEHFHKAVIKQGFRSLPCEVSHYPYSIVNKKICKLFHSNCSISISS